MTGKFYHFLIEVTVLLLISFTTTIPVFAQNKTDTNANKISKTPHSISLTYKIIDADSSTFGYDIYTDGNLALQVRQVLVR